MWYTLPGMMILALIVGTGDSVHAESPALLLEKGVYAEETAGNVDEAIGIYQKIIAEARQNRKFVAQASYRLGKCYLKKGHKAKAAEMFKQIASDFADQKGPVAAAIKELATLEPSWTPGRKSPSRPELPAEVMRYITQLHVKACEQAKAHGLTINTHVYGVDNEFQKYQGGLLMVANTTTQPVDHEMGMGNTDFVNYDFYNEKGEPQSLRMIERPKARMGRYRMVWTPDRPIQPGEIRMLSYIGRATPKLIKAAGGYCLRMHNHFGMPVLENFFLVLPANVGITDSTANHNSVKRIGIFDVYLWQRQVPANTTNEVTVTLVQKSPTTQADKLEAERLSALGWDLWKQQIFTAAEKMFEAAVAKDPANANAWNGLGWSQFNQGKPLAAQKAFEQSVTLNPNAAAALNGLGWIAKREGKTDDAVKYWKQAVKVAPGTTAALAGLCQTYMEKKDYAAAAKYYEMWIKADPNDAAARQGLQEARKKAGVPPAPAADERTEKMRWIIHEMTCPPPNSPPFAALNEIIKFGKDAVPLLVEEMKTGDNWQIPKALGIINDPHAVPPLIDKLGKPERPPMNEIVAEALQNITGRNFGTDAAKWRTWWTTEGQKNQPATKPSDSTT